MDIGSERGLAMVRLRLLLMLAGVCGLVLLTAGGSAQAGTFCRDAAVDRDVGLAAHDKLDVARLSALSQRFDDTALPDPGCGDRVAHCVGLKLSLAFVDRAYGLLGQDPPDMEGARTFLQKGKTQGGPWQLLVALGDVEAALARQTNDTTLYRSAASNLQFALNQIVEPPLCSAFGEIRPTGEELARIRRRAQEAVMLSPHFEIARTRGGECGGIFLDTTRGVDVEPVPVPITFEYDKSVLTDEGKKAASALLECLKSKNLTEITLSGHTDLHGGDTYNMDLSAKRLSAVQALLKAGGYAGVVHLVPKGKREPFQPDDPGQHSQAEIDQLNRRVELREIH